MLRRGRRGNDIIDLTSVSFCLVTVTLQNRLLFQNRLFISSKCFKQGLVSECFKIEWLEINLGSSFKPAFLKRFPCHCSDISRRPCVLVYFLFLALSQSILLDSQPCLCLWQRFKPRTISDPGFLGPSCWDGKIINAPQISCYFIVSWLCLLHNYSRNNTMGRHVEYLGIHRKPHSAAILGRAPESTFWNGWYLVFLLWGSTSVSSVHALQTFHASPLGLVSLISQGSFA